MKKLLLALLLCATSVWAAPPATYVPRSIKELDDARGVSLSLKFVPIYDGTKFTPRLVAESDVTNLVTDLAAKQALDSDLTSIAALATTSFGRGSLALADAAAFRTYIGAGSSSFDGTFASLTGKPTTLVGYGITDAQPLDADLTTYAGITPSANVQTLLGSATYAAFRTSLGLVIGTDVQAYDADLTTYAAITPSANVQSLLGAATYAAMKTQLALTIGTDVQAYDADLTTWAGITPGTGVGTFLATPSSSNLAAALTDETGTGATVFGTSPTFTTPILGVSTGTSLALTQSNAQTQTNTVTGLGITTLPGLQVTNSTAAAAGAQQYSPSIRWTGQGWKTTATAASQAVEFRSYVVPVQGTTAPTGKWTLDSSINGGAFSLPIAYGTDGTMIAPGNASFVGGGFGFGDGTTLLTAKTDGSNATIVVSGTRAIRMNGGSAASSVQFEQGWLTLGSSFLYGGNAGVVESNSGSIGTLRDFKGRAYYYSSTVYDSAGSGTPEGVITAGIGSTYRRTDGGAATSFYVKESGASNTGWVAK